VRIIELRNDLDAITTSVKEALEAVYSPSAVAAASADSSSVHSSAATDNVDSPRPFARVDGVAPGSPASDAGLQREDIIVRFGGLTDKAFSSASLQPLVDAVAANENRSITIKVLRANQPVFLSLVPRKGWGGRGMLGCHIVPYSPP